MDEALAFEIVKAIRDKELEESLNTGYSKLSNQMEIKPTSWEYLIIRMDAVGVLSYTPPRYERDFDDEYDLISFFGMEGWELITIAQFKGISGTTYYFKRQKLG